MKKHLSNFIIEHRVMFAFLTHLLLGAAAFSLAFAIRFDFKSLAPLYRSLWLTYLPVAVLVKGVFLLYFKVARGLWRYVGVDELVRILKATAAGSLTLMVVVMMTYGHGFPRSIYILDFLTTTVIYGGFRFGIRLFREVFRQAVRASSGKRTLIVGAGDAGEMALRSLMKNYMGIYQVVGFLDDDPRKRNMLIHGVPIIGTTEAAGNIVRDYEITEILIAISDASNTFIKNLVERCSTHNVNFSIMPAIKDIMTGEFRLDRMRKLKVEDLLGRDAVCLDCGPVARVLSGKRVLVTGAGGSIGSELSRQIAKFRPEALILVDVAETPLFEIHNELKALHPDLNVNAILADIKHKHEIMALFNKYLPQRVFHAAAYKHVPLMEQHPCLAVKNNIIGTKNLAEAAVTCGAERFVMISSDKAVYPSSVMGASKRICELVISKPHAGECRFASVRFGNVLGSNGSVMTIFEKQIAAGGPVTITSPEMTRYFMTIPEAVSLVLQAGTRLADNDLFVLDMGVPVKIIDLAHNAIRLSGFEVDKDIQIKIIGMRPGEKLHEELVTHSADLVGTDVPKLNRLSNKNIQNTYSGFDDDFDRLIKAAEIGDDEQVRSIIWDMVQRDIDQASKN